MVEKICTEKEKLKQELALVIASSWDEGRKTPEFLVRLFGKDLIKEVEERVHGNKKIR